MIKNLLQQVLCFIVRDDLLKFQPILIVIIVVFCDTLPFSGNLTHNQILKQIDLIIRNSPKIQKARQIEVSFN